MVDSKENYKFELGVKDLINQLQGNVYQPEGRIDVGE